MIENTRKKSKWLLWASIISVVIFLCSPLVLFRLKHRAAFNRKVEALVAAGYPVSSDDLQALYVLPEGAENAADLYIDAFNAYIEPNEAEGLLLPSQGAYEPNENHPPYPPEVIAAIRNSVEQNAECLQLLDEAAQIDDCLFPRVYDGLATRVDYLREMKDSAHILSERNILLAHSGQMDALFDSTASCLALSRRIPDYPCLIECLVSSLIQLIAVESLENSFNMVHFSEEQFSVLQGEFQQLIQSNTLTPAIIAESTWFIEVTGLSPQEYLKIHGGWHGGKPWEKGGFFLYHLSGFNYKDAVLMSELFEQWVEISLLPLEQQPGELEKLDKLVDASASGLNGYGILMYMPATKRASEINLRVKGQLQIAETALAIERYRLKHDSLPDTLEALVPEFIDTVYLDPFDGKPIRYVKYEDGYMLYTIGEDGIDNGGLDREQMSKKLGGTSSKEYDHPFTVRREK